MVTKKKGAESVAVMEKPGAGGPEVAASVEVRPLDSLAAYARNARTHDEDQVAQLMGSILEWGWTNPVLADGNGIVAGHGRCMAARRLYEQGKTIRLPNGTALPHGTVPVIDVSGWSEAKRRAYIIADNKLAMNADWDYSMLSIELQELRGLDFDIDLVGFDAEELGQILSGEGKEVGGEGSGGSDPEYSTKIDTPVYTPKGEKPEVASLVDPGKVEALIEKINGSNVSDEEKAFLLRAAARHAVFDYHSIAEYYCHASPEMQALMEDSALVIIDFNKAIADGYVELSKKLEGIYSASYDDEGGDDDED